MLPALDPSCLTLMLFPRDYFEKSNVKKYLLRTESHNEKLHHMQRVKMSLGVYNYSQDMK